jgi:2'-5' RNA ligase
VPLDDLEEQREQQGGGMGGMFGGGEEEDEESADGRSVEDGDQPNPNEVAAEREEDDAGGGGGRPEVKRALAVVDKKDGPHKFSSTQFNLADAGYSRSQGSPLPALKALADAIPDADLAADGREEEYHVTIKYGLHTADAEEVRQVVEGFGPVEITLGATSIFPAKETGPQRGGDAYDVVKVDVDSPDLYRLNRVIADALEHTDTHPKYQPHVTLAYVKPGRGKRYVGNDAVEGKTLNLSDLVFSNQEGERTVISLSGVRPEVARALEAVGANGVAKDQCKPGERHDLTGCTPAEDEGGGTGKPDNTVEEKPALKPIADYVGQRTWYVRDEDVEPLSDHEEACEKLLQENKGAASVAKWYTGKGYEGLNAASRNCPPDFGCLDATQKKKFNVLESAIAAAPKFRQSVMLFRGIDAGSIGLDKLKGVFQAHKEAGSEFSLPSLTSTSSNPKTMGNEAFGGRTGLVLQIKAKTGLAVKSVSRKPDEEEVIQSARTRYKVTAIAEAEMWGGKKNVVYLEEV